MTIDTSGKWWKGNDFRDLAEYIRRYMGSDYSADQIVRCICTCGNTHFRLRADADEGYAQRICTACGVATFICDSDEYRQEAEPKSVRCPCRRTIFEVGVGFSFRTDGEVRWLFVAERCVSCGVLGSCTDWKIDYSPSHQLLTQA